MASRTMEGQRSTIGESLQGTGSNAGDVISTKWTSENHSTTVRQFGSLAMPNF